MTNKKLVNYNKPTRYCGITKPTQKFEDFTKTPLRLKTLQKFSFVSKMPLRFFKITPLIVRGLVREREFL